MKKRKTKKETLPTGETMLVGQPLDCSDLDRIRNCTHEWVVFSTALDDVCLLLECVKCGALGTVDDPTADEWDEAFHASENPYGWGDWGRVTVRGICGYRHVERADSNL